MKKKIINNERYNDDGYELPGVEQWGDPLLN